MDLGQLHLNTPRVQLRVLQDSDAPALFALYTDPVVLRYWSHGPWADEAQALAMMARDRQGMAQGESLRLGLVPTGTSEVVGTVSLFNHMAAHRRAEIGYALRPDHHGRGLMHDALLAVVGWAFSELKVNRLEADIDPRNLASARSLERLGFQREGFLPERWIVGDEVSDTALYGLLLSRWAARPVPTSG
jgi:[ribosomal protein S5]-alanine N-acetyltransferase